MFPPLFVHPRFKFPQLYVPKFKLQSGQKSTNGQSDQWTSNCQFDSVQAMARMIIGQAMVGVISCKAMVKMIIVQAIVGVTSGQAKIRMTCIQAISMFKLTSGLNRVYN